MPRCPNPRCQATYPNGTPQCTKGFCRCLLPEAVVAGRYRIETLIGLGGMGAVYRASDTFEVMQVALKVLSFTGGSTDVATAVERFRREARYAHQLSHKNIVPILNFGQDGTLLYIAMPLITGGTLRALLKSEHSLSIAQMKRYIDDLADAIDAIHAHPQQIVHRDIKPSNLLIHQDDGRLMVADFGIARAMQQEKALTQRGTSLGTEHYIAPEQEKGKAEPASDIYSMGVVAYQMFTGLLPFQAVVKSHSAELPPPSTLNSHLPRAVDAVILRAMEIDPAKRYNSARAFADALGAALATEERPTPAVADTLVANSNANVIVRTLVPENPCGKCGRENRGGSRFCRFCGHRLEDTSPLLMEVCQVGYNSDIGSHTSENEDMLLIIQGLCTTLTPPPRPFSLLAVADGLRGRQGKSSGGHDASRLAVETISDALVPLLTLTAQTPLLVARDAHGIGGQPSRSVSVAPRPDTVLQQWIRDAVQQANRVIYHCNADYDTAMSSTLTTALIYKRRLYVASVGDSRIYHYNADQGLHCLNSTQMHVITDQSPQVDELAKNAQRDQHTHYLGQAYHVPIETLEQEVAP
ncbi:MAG: protein kinase, partial [Ktedonobacteraceae bacterium]|nr:protein kinase [Ktedonobacteraceae bacterium]